METQPPFSSPEGKENVVSPDEFLRLRDARFAEQLMTKLAHPAFIGRARSLLQVTIEPEETAGEARQLFDLVHGQQVPLKEGTTDPLEALFAQALDSARTTEQKVALHALRQLHRAALAREGHNEVSHARVLVYAIIGPPPRNPGGPRPVA